MTEFVLLLLGYALVLSILQLQKKEILAAVMETQPYPDTFQNETFTKYIFLK